MPTYLRWLTAIVSGIVAQLSYFIVVGAIALGTDNRELSGAVGALITFGQSIVGALGALAVNDWLAKRYPARSARDEERVG